MNQIKKFSPGKRKQLILGKCSLQNGKIFETIYLITQITKKEHQKQKPNWVM